MKPQTHPLHCPSCGQSGTSVKDSRPRNDSVRRRRVCDSCGYRFTTYEMLEKPMRLEDLKRIRKQLSDIVSYIDMMEDHLP